MAFRKVPPLEYRKFRVRGHIKSFRDLEVYKKTIELSSGIYGLKPKCENIPKQIFESELGILRTLSKIPYKLIAESYETKFKDNSLAQEMLLKAEKAIAVLIAKTDFLKTFVVDLEGRRELEKLARAYQVQKRKVGNLRRAWERWSKKFEPSNAKKD